jgi:hypothetical protein
MIHQKAQPPAIQSEDRLVMGHCFVQHVQHMAVTAKRDNAIGIGNFMLTIAFDQPRAPFNGTIMAGC